MKWNFQINSNMLGPDMTASEPLFAAWQDAYYGPPTNHLLPRGPRHGRQAQAARGPPRGRPPADALVRRKPFARGTARSSPHTAPGAGQRPEPESPDRPVF